MFTSIFKGILPVGILAGAICYPLSLWKTEGMAYFLVKCVVFVMIYFFAQWKWGIKTEERNYIKQSLHIK